MKLLHRVRDSRGTYIERGTTYGRGYSRSYIDIYTQPWWRHALAVVGEGLNKAWYELPFWKRLDRLDGRWHNRSCNDDCAVFTTVATGEKMKSCGHIPLSARLDIFVFELARQDRVLVRRHEGEKTSR